MKIEAEKSIRAYDGAILTWHRKTQKHGPAFRIQPGPWILIGVEKHEIPQSISPSTSET